LRQSISFGAEMVHMGLSILVLFFFYRDGEKVAGHVVILVQRLAGEQTQRIVHIIRSTLRAVVYGIIGTALVQALAALIGLIVAGVPYPYVFGVVSFFLAIIPMGLTLLWLPVAGWLLAEGQTGWAMFIVVWFVLFVGTIDNWLRPILISREVELPIVLIVFGIFGGILSFGFIGVFLGPTLLSTGFAIVVDWIIHKEKEVLQDNAPKL
jgi:predicted PurR-regulated permease PerM